MADSLLQLLAEEPVPKIWNDRFAATCLARFTKLYGHGRVGDGEETVYNRVVHLHGSEVRDSRFRQCGTRFPFTSHRPV